MDKFKWYMFLAGCSTVLTIVFRMEKDYWYMGLSFILAVYGLYKGLEKEVN